MTKNSGDDNKRLVAVGKVSKSRREMHVTVESMSEIGKAAVKHVFGNDTRRAEEIANA